MAKGVIMRLPQIEIEHRPDGTFVAQWASPSGLSAAGCSEQEAKARLFDALQSSEQALGTFQERRPLAAASLLEDIAMG